MSVFITAVAIVAVVAVVTFVTNYFELNFIEEICTVNATLFLILAFLSIGQGSLVTTAMLFLVGSLNLLAIDTNYRNRCQQQRLDNLVNRFNQIFD